MCKIEIYLKWKANRIKSKVKKNSHGKVWLNYGVLQQKKKGATQQ